MKRCKTCGIDKPIDNFAKKTAHCKKCRAAYRKTLVDFIWEYKKQHACVDCGIADPRVLQFDHLRDKLYNIADMPRLRVTLQKIIDEIAKCVIRCANCHQIKTFERAGIIR